MRDTFIKLLPVFLIIFACSCKKDEFKRVAVIKTGFITETETKKAVVKGNIIDAGEGISSFGHCWSPEVEPDINDSSTSFGMINNPLEYSSSISNLKHNTQYYVRAFAVSENKIVYGAVRSFLTRSGQAALWIEISSITPNSALAKCRLLGIDGKLISKGMCWDTVNNFTLSDCEEKIEASTNTEAYEFQITGLKPGKSYTMAAYAISDVDTSYGNFATFRTRDGIAVMTTSNISNITINSAITGGAITNDGGAAITRRGVCWNKSGNPTINDAITNNGSGIGTFVSSLSGLDINTTYFVRSYATNSIGTTYGSEKTFISKNGIPTIVCYNPSNITVSSASCSYQIQDTGGTAVLVQGLCYNTTGNPTLLDTKTINSTYLSGLTKETTYYVRAYVINAVDTTYSSVISFTTLSGIPVVSTYDASQVRGNSVISGVQILSNGGTDIIKKGLCWSTETDPTIDDNKMEMGEIMGMITGLSPGLVYFIRAYATTSFGTAYGNQISVLTEDLPEIEMSSLNVISSSSAVCAAEVVNDWGIPVTERGVCWSFSPTPTINDNKTSDGNGKGTYVSTISPLSINATYYIRAYATSSRGTAYSQQYTFTFRIITDNDGNTYPTRLIGTQEWMTENLRTTRLNDGTNINLSSGNFDSTEPLYVWYHNDENNKADYGALYNWYAVNSNKLCPSGWHVPSKTEWETMLSLYGGINQAGGDLKETGTSHWFSPNSWATNASGFTALPGGYTAAIFFDKKGYNGYFWTSSEYSASNAYRFIIRYDYRSLVGDNINKKYGYSVRCIKD